MSNYGLIYARLVGEDKPWAGACYAEFTWSDPVREQTWEFEYVNEGDKPLTIYSDGDDDDSMYSFYFNPSLYPRNFNVPPYNYFHSATEFEFELDISDPFIIPAGGVSPTITLTIRWLRGIPGADSWDSDLRDIISTVGATIQLPFITLSLTAATVYDADSTYIYCDEPTPYESIDVEVGVPYDSVITFVNTSTGTYDGENVYNSAHPSPYIVDSTGGPLTSDKFEIEFFYIDWTPFDPTTDNIYLAAPSTEYLRYRITFNQPVYKELISISFWYQVGFSFANNITTEKRFTTSTTPYVNAIEDHTAGWVIPAELEEFSLYGSDVSGGANKRFYTLYKPTLDFYDVGFSLDWDYIQLARWHGEITFNKKVNSISIQLGLNYREQPREQKEDFPDRETLYSRSGPWFLFVDQTQPGSFSHEFALAVLNQTTGEWRLYSLSDDYYNVGTLVSFSVPRSWWTSADFTEDEKLIYQIVRCRMKKPLYGSGWEGGIAYLAADGNHLTTMGNQTAIETQSYAQSQQSASLHRTIFLTPPDTNYRTKYTLVNAVYYDGSHPDGYESQHVLNSLVLNKVEASTDFTEFTFVADRLGQSFSNSEMNVRNTGSSPLTGVATNSEYYFYGPETFGPTNVNLDVGESQNFTYTWEFNEEPVVDEFTPESYTVQRGASFAYTGARTQFPPVPYTKTAYYVESSYLTQYDVHEELFEYDQETTSWANYNLNSYVLTDKTNVEWEWSIGNYYRTVMTKLKKMVGWKIGSI